MPTGIDFAAQPPQLLWRPTDGGRFAEPFFDDTLSRLRRAAAGRPPVSTTPLASWRQGSGATRPAAFILHVSRCGSTLLSRMLAALPVHLVVSEARIFDDILRAQAPLQGMAPDWRDACLASAVEAFAASQALPAQRLFIKLDCWHLFELQRLRRVFPGVPLLFVHRHPLEVLVSLMQRPSFTLVRDTVTPEEMGVSAEQRDAMPPEVHAAAILGAFFREAARQREQLVSVPYEALPDLAWSGMAGLRFSPQEVAALRLAGENDAKHPDGRFVPDAERKRAAASGAIRAACAQWAEPAYERWCSGRD
ncbi:sulfotransferase [Solimonas sp. K1W22B-7]|uniref:sulfotransferase n=1 Tax=Solimonas sp. K1W22B-7 TaxID=2303331 RepID=UPI0013C45D02|nr:sulfotransferase [Solimonas sp. K1W22B-7]